jgi:hypothetical protein
MSLNHSFKAAKKKIDALDADERRRLTDICEDIYRAQVQLSEKAQPILAKCMAGCQGLCCRNIIPADIVTEWDLIYILAMTPQVETAMAACLQQEAFFSADCIFLVNGTGPCLFPDNLRPERCIISFCQVEPLVEQEIKQVMRGFSRLIRFFMFRPVLRWCRRVSRLLRIAPRA